MPNVGGVEYPYTAEGKREADKARRATNSGVTPEGIDTRTIPAAPMKGTRNAMTPRSMPGSASPMQAYPQRVARVAR